MLKQYFNIFRRLLILSDCLLISGSFFLAYYIRKHLDGLFFANLYFIKVYIWILPVVVILWIWALYAMGMYESFRLKRIRTILWTILKSSFLSFFIFGAVSYVFKIENISRSFVVIFFLIAVVLMMLEKVVLIIIFHNLRASGHNFRNILVVGTGPRAQEFIKYLDTHRELGLKVIGLLDEDLSLVGTNVGHYEVLGTFDDIAKVLHDYVIDFAVFIVPRSTLSKVENALVQCELMGVTASVAMDLFNLKFTVGKETRLMGIPMIIFEMTPQSITALVIKRLIDIVISMLALFIISPVYLCIAILIKLSSPGPVYFVQERCGLSGRKFKLYKFRTMVVDAEEKLQELLVHNEMKGHAFKMENDPRITPIGKFLRKLSLDELPQLWNVFHGDMSLVGPRPPLPREVKDYDPWHQRRLSMRPGITCLWQVGGRNRIRDFDEWVRLDLQYIDNWSLWLDFKILFKTIPAVLSTSGAK